MSGPVCSELVDSGTDASRQTIGQTQYMILCLHKPAFSEPCYGFCPYLGGLLGLPRTAEMVSF
jgi:hypothetical protein